MKKLMLRKTSLVCLGLFLGMGHAMAQQVAIGFRSTDGNYWKMQTETLVETTEAADVTIRSDQPAQTFKGWGTCFNELDYEAWNLLSEADRTLFIKRAFNPDGDLRLTVGRIPVGASDYACDWYSCDETPGNTEDFAMEHFTIERDLQRIIPSIRLAQAEQPAMTFWASPWSPPQWMKKNKHYAQAITSTNGNTEAFPPLQRDQFVEDERYYHAYCLYFDRFIQAYAEQGIPITGLAYQNEAYSNTPYPGCSWLSATTGKFLAEYLGPYMAEHQPDVTLIAGTFNTNRWDVFQTILSTPGIDRYVRQVGFQWEGRQQVAAVRSTWPQYELVQTESECGGGTFDWGAAVHTFELCNHYLSNGITTYTYWNAILKDGGYSTWGWRQNALVQVNSAARTAYYTPEYYAYKHYTHLIPVGSKILQCDPSRLLVSALRPDGSVVVVIGNDSGSDRELSIDIDGQLLHATLPANSFSTYLCGAEGTVADVLRQEASGLCHIERDFLTEEQYAQLSDAVDAGGYDALLSALQGVLTGHGTPTFTPSAELYQPVAAGSYFLYDITAGKFLGQVAAGAEANQPRLASAPERIALKQTAKGYTLRFENRPTASGYLKLGVYNGQYAWADGAATSTYWTLAADDTHTFTLTAEAGHYTLGSGEQLSGAWYLAGTNVSNRADEAHRYALISIADYIRETQNATPALLGAATGSDVTSGWLREKNSASGYAEQQPAISSFFYGGYGISHWAASPQTNARIIYQQVSGLPAGTYTLTVFAAATLWNNNNGGDNREGISLFMGDGAATAATPVTTAQYAPYTLTFDLSEGNTLQLGLRAEAVNGNNWAFLADVRLAYQAPSQPDAIHAMNPGTVEDGSCYDLSGRQWADSLTSHNVRHKGILIRGGQKFAVR
ncbi:MAG: hypothetical protein IJ700_08960 [Bacteroidaceae bacterium]|nr:hypothetical protein [Bacteroidaceae bacterium]MBR1683461.1 hypothetical protein [Bacteroidaceae bacterium]